ncbi:hypothetical protein DVH05_005099 [Phytophthora capsici]|nr:hypothetical protein DVH05_005099 [Phytophthora capsici]
MKQLHTELVQLQESDWSALCIMEGTPVKQPASVRQWAHVPIQVDEWREGNNGQGRKR